MKKYCNVTLSIEVESEQDIDINNLNFNDAHFDCNNVHIKVIDVPDCYEVEI